MKMESKITLTFMIMFAISVIISGINSVVVEGKGFFTFQMWADAIFYAFVYLIYIWINTRKHKTLAWLGLFVILTLIGIYFLTIAEAISVTSTATVTDTGLVFSIDKFIIFVLRCTYCFIAYGIARRQGEKLLEEDKVSVNVNIILTDCTDSTKPEYVDWSE